jgi:addiction module HigA family antidote
MINGESALNGREKHLVHQMSKSLTTIRRNVVAIPTIHPGEHLAEELKELSMSAAELARQLGVPTNRVTAILNGRRAITGDTALRLAHFFGTTAEFWLNLQSLYELRVAQKKAGKSISRLPTLKHFEDAHA